MATVLVVDDHPDLREVLVRMLELHGHTVRACESGEAALETLSNGDGKPDMVVVDDRMSGVSGLEVARQIRLDSRLNPIFVVVWSADASCQPKALAGGADDFWIKGSEAMLESIQRLEETLRSKRKQTPAPLPVPEP
jgi:CheY-like chemotaxis protein